MLVRSYQLLFFGEGGGRVMWIEKFSYSFLRSYGGKVFFFNMHTFLFIGNSSMISGNGRS